VPAVLQSAEPSQNRSCHLSRSTDMGAKTGSGSKDTTNDTGKSGNDSGSRVKEARGRPTSIGKGKTHRTKASSTRASILRIRSTRVPRTCIPQLTRTAATASPTRVSRK